MMKLPPMNPLDSRAKTTPLKKPISCSVTLPLSFFSMATSSRRIPPSDGFPVGRRFETVTWTEASEHPTRGRSYMIAICSALWAMSAVREHRQPGQNLNLNLPCMPSALCLSSTANEEKKKVFVLIFFLTLIILEPNYPNLCRQIDSLTPLQTKSNRFHR